MKALVGKNIVVTGANRGIGKAVISMVAQKGANIWACVRKIDNSIVKTMKEIEREYDIWIELVELDLENENSIKEAAKCILSSKKPVYGLVNNAGIPHSGTILMTDIKEMKHVMDVNYFSQMQLIQYIARGMIKRKKGVIINVASYCGIEPGEGYIAYGASKAAMIWATKSIARELGRYSIRVNGVAPGFIDTRMGVEYNSEKLLESNIQKTVMQRLGNANEIASVICFLLSDEASFITGQIVSADGGRVY